eukprot:1280707-Pyramimonas_sp.AAC.2
MKSQWLGDGAMANVDEVIAAAQSPAASRSASILGVGPRLLLPLPSRRATHVVFEPIDLETIADRPRTDRPRLSAIDL